MNRFWAKVDKTPGQGPKGQCWTWLGYTDIDGYGHLRHNGKLTRAHRVSWEIHHGPIPNGLNALHRCDNPPCVNPSDLFLGTHVENMKDKAAKGRAKNQTTVQR